MIKRITKFMVVVMLLVTMNINPIAIIGQAIAQSSLAGDLSTIARNAYLIAIDDVYNPAEVLATGYSIDLSTIKGTSITTDGTVEGTKVNAESSTDEEATVIPGTTSVIDYGPVLEEIKTSVGSQLDEVESLKEMYEETSYTYRVAHLFSMNNMFDKTLWRPTTDEIPFVEDYVYVAGKFAGVYSGYWDASIKPIQTAQYTVNQSTPVEFNYEYNRYYNTLGSDVLLRYEGAILNPEATAHYSMNSDPLNNGVEDSTHVYITKREDGQESSVGSVVHYVSELIPEEQITWGDAVKTLYRALGQEELSYTTFISENSDITPENSPVYNGMDNITKDDNEKFAGYNVYMFMSRCNPYVYDYTAGELKTKDIYFERANNEGFILSQTTKASDPIQASEFWVLAEDMMMAYGEEYLNVDEVNSLLQVYGSEYPIQLGYEVADAWAFLKVRGCLAVPQYPTDYISRNTLLDICTRIADDSFREDYKNISIVLDLADVLIEDGYYPVKDLSTTNGQFKSSTTINYEAIEDYTYVIPTQPTGAAPSEFVYVHSTNSKSDTITGAKGSALTYNGVNYLVINVPKTHSGNIYASTTGDTTICIPSTALGGGVYGGVFDTTGTSYTVSSEDSNVTPFHEYYTSTKLFDSFADWVNSGISERPKGVEVASNATVLERLAYMWDSATTPLISRADYVEHTDRYWDSDVGTKIYVIEFADVSDEGTETYSSDYNYHLSSGTGDTGALGYLYGYNNNLSVVQTLNSLCNMYQFKSTSSSGTQYINDWVGSYSSVLQGMGNKYLNNEDVSWSMRVGPNTLKFTPAAASYIVRNGFASGSYLIDSDDSEVLDGDVIKLTDDASTVSSSIIANIGNSINGLGVTYAYQQTKTSYRVCLDPDANPASFAAWLKLKDNAKGVDNTDSTLSELDKLKVLDTDVHSSVVMSREEQILISWSDLVDAGYAVQMDNGGQPTMDETGTYQFFTPNGLVKVNDTQKTIQVGTTLYDLNPTDDLQAPIIAYIDETQNNELYFDIRCITGVIKENYITGDTKRTVSENYLGAATLVTYDFSSAGTLSSLWKAKSINLFNVPEISSNSMGKGYPVDVIGATAFDGASMSDGSKYWTTNDKVMTEMNRIPLGSFIPTANWVAVIDDDGKDIQSSLFVYYLKEPFVNGYLEGGATHTIPDPGIDYDVTLNTNIKSKVESTYGTIDRNSEWYMRMTAEAINNLYEMTGAVYLSKDYVVREFILGDSSIEAPYSNYNKDTITSSTDGCAYWVEGIGYVYNMPTYEEFSLGDYLSGKLMLPLATYSSGNSWNVYNFNMAYYGTKPDGAPSKYGEVVNGMGWLSYENSVSNPTNISDAIDERKGSEVGGDLVPPIDLATFKPAPAGLYSYFGRNRDEVITLKSINEFTSKSNLIYYGTNRIQISGSQTDSSDISVNMLSMDYNTVLMDADAKMYRVQRSANTDVLVMRPTNIVADTASGVNEVIIDEYPTNQLENLLDGINASYLISKIDSGASMVILITFEVIPMILIIIMTILVGLSFVCDIKVLQLIFDKTIDPIKLLTFGVRDYKTWRWNKVLIPCILLYILIALYMNANIIRIIQALAEWYGVINNWIQTL